MRDYDRGFVHGLWAAKIILEKSCTVEDALSKIKTAIKKIVDERMEKILENLKIFEE